MQFIAQIERSTGSATGAVVERIPIDFPDDATAVADANEFNRTDGAKRGQVCRLLRPDGSEVPGVTVPLGLVRISDRYADLRVARRGRQ